MRPAVSVIVPVHNASPFLPALFAALAAQTLADMEIILVNDGSTDDSGAQCEAFAQAGTQRRVVHHPCARGVSCARNSGLEMATGHWIGFADADDIPAPALYETLWRVGEAEALDLVLCNARRFVQYAEDRDERLVIAPPPAGVVDGVDYFRTVVGQDNFVMMVYLALARRSLLDDPVLRFVPGIINEDILWMSALQLRSRRVRYVDAVLYHYRITPGSLTLAQDTAGLLRRVEGYAQVARALLQMQSRAPEQAHAALQRVAVHAGMGLVDHARRIHPAWRAWPVLGRLEAWPLMVKLFRLAPHAKARRRLLRGMLIALPGLLVRWFSARTH